MSENRNLSFDYIKGVLIFFVVWGHFLVWFAGLKGNDPVFKWIYSFHMPLFVFISGWFFSSKGSFIDLIKKQFKRLLIPQFTFVICGFIIFACFWNGYSYKLIENDLFSIKKFYHFVTFAWYLWCIFFCSLIVDACKRLFKEKSKYVLIIICIGMWLFVDLLPGPIFNNQQVARMLPCYCLGMLARRYETDFSICKKNTYICKRCYMRSLLLFIYNKYGERITRLSHKDPFATFPNVSCVFVL